MFGVALMSETDESEENETDVLFSARLFLLGSSILGEERRPLRGSPISCSLCLIGLVHRWWRTHRFSV
eukprot:scaffold12040_cov144-Skeletonema_dohrnii-CCMP3373.AAC.4